MARWDDNDGIWDDVDCLWAAHKVAERWTGDKGVGRVAAGWIWLDDGGRRVPWSDNRARHPFCGVVTAPHREEFVCDPQTEGCVRATQEGVGDVEVTDEDRQVSRLALSRNTPVMEDVDEDLVRMVQEAAGEARRRNLPGRAPTEAEIEHFAGDVAFRRTAQGRQDSANLLAEWILSKIGERKKEST